MNSSILINVETERKLGFLLLLVHNINRELDHINQQYAIKVDT
jgi:hypothetical protein